MAFIVGTPDPMNDLDAPGIAWDRASQALRLGNIEEAKKMLPHMLVSDRGLMEKMIAEAEKRSL